MSTHLMLSWDLFENPALNLTTVVVVTHRIPTIFNIPYRQFIIENKGLYEVN